MRFCVFFAVLLLRPALSLSAGTTDTTTVLPPATTPTGETTDTTTVSSPATTATPTTPTEETSVTPTANSTTNATEETTSVTPTANSTTNATEGNITTTTVTPAATTTTKPSSDPCKPNPCGTNSAKCISLYSDHVCQCPYGFYYDSSTCYPGKIFPGTIILAGTYPKDIETVNSSLYQQMSENLTAFFEAAFNLTDYKQTVIVKVHVTTGNTRSENSGVSITVMNIFEKNTSETTETVIDLIMAEANRSNSVYLYSDTSHCAVFDCDNATTECQESEYPECKCKNGLSKTEWDDRSCSDCSSDCSANNNKYCAKANGVPQCYCMTNFKEEGEKCVSCPVGYSGQNCENNFELILIIVGTVFGAIILCLVVAVSIVSVRAKYSKDPEKKSLIKPGHSNPDTSSETRIFPRVQTTSGHGNPGYQPNPYEARSSNRNRFLDGDYDDVYDMSREPEGFRMQRR